MYKDKQLILNLNEGRDEMDLQIPLVPSLEHYTGQLVLQAASYCFGDQIQVCDIHSSAGQQDQNIKMKLHQYILENWHQSKISKRLTRKTFKIHLISSTTRKAPKVYLNFQNYEFHIMET